MRIEFRHGIPDDATLWLRTHVGPGMVKTHDVLIVEDPDYGWYYQRVRTKMPHSDGAEKYEYIPTITIKDEQLAVLFKLSFTP